MEGRRVLLCGIVLTLLLSIANQSQADPGVDAGGPYEAYEGTIVKLTATTDDPSLVLWRWDFDNDGVPDSDWEFSLTMSYSVERYYCDDHHGYVAVEVWDGFSTKTVIIDGEPVLVPDTETDTARVDVYNALPTLDPGGPYLGSPGVPITFQAIGKDLGCDDLTFVWLWGDGSYDVETYEGSWNPTEAVDQRTHAYVAEGTYTVTLLLLDDDGGYTEARFKVFVRSGIDDIDDLIDYTEGLPIPGGIRKGLIAQLSAAKECLQRDHERPATRILTAFMHRVEVLEMRGTLSEDQAEHMNMCAQKIIEAISES